MKNDPAHVATDAEIAKIEKLITKEYKKAHKEVSDKLDDYLARFAAKDAKWQEWVANGTKTKKEYTEWRKGQMLVGKRWEDLRDSLATDLTNTAKIAQSIAKGYAPEVYAINHNYATFEVEKGSLLDTSYSLYNREAVEYMYKDKPKLYHTYGKAVAKEIKEGKQHAWDRRRITSVLTQAILQGESIPKITKRLEHVTKGDHKAAIRNARTMMTGVQNAGRVDAYERAKALGIPVRKQWLATLDARTRHWHKELDGVIVENDEPFENEFGKIMFPGDPEAHAANVYNCRCTLMAAIKGFEIDTKNTDLRHDANLGGMSYDEWKATKKSISNPIDLPEQKAANIQGAWWGKYGGGAAKQHKFTGAEGKALMDKYEQEELNKQYSGIWANKTVTPSDYSGMKKSVNDKKWNLDKQIKKATANGDAKALAKYQAQLDDLLDFEKQGKKWEKLHPTAPKPPVSKKTTAKAKQPAPATKAAQTANKQAQKAPKPKKVTEKEALKNVEEAQKKVDKLVGESFSDIWKDPVSPADYPAKKGSIAAKKQYFQDKYDEALQNGWQGKIDKFHALLDELAEFEDLGKKYELAKAELDAAKKAYDPFIVKKEAKLKPKIDALKKDLASFGGDEYDLTGVHWNLNGVLKVEDYSTVKKKITSVKKSLKSDIDTYNYWMSRSPSDRWQKKLEEAQEKLKKLEAYEEAGKKYAKTKRDLEKVEQKLASLRAPSPNAAGGAYSQARKDKALWAKTSAEYRKNDAVFDKHARTIHNSKSAFEHEGYYHYTWGSGPFNQPLAGFKGGWGGTFVGPGKLDIDVGGYGSRIRGLTQLCAKSKQPVDFWVQSGQTLETLEGMLKLPYGTLRGMSDAQLQQFVGAQKEIPQFISGAINKGGGSYTPGNMLFNIYCPKGSEALYVLEDGYFHKNEHEMILQRGGTYKITKIYWGRDEVHGGKKLIVDMELRLENGYNKFQQ